MSVKSFITLAPGPNVIKLFTDVGNELECLLLTGFYSLVCLWVRPGECPEVEHLLGNGLARGLRFKWFLHYDENRSKLGFL